MIVPLFVGRDKSVRALEDVMKNDKQVLLVTQKNASDDDPAKEDIYTIGTIGTVLQLLKLPDGTVKVLVKGRNGRALVIMRKTPIFLKPTPKLSRKAIVLPLSCRRWAELWCPSSNNI